MCVCLVCRVLLCRGCNPRLSRVRRSLNPRAPQSAQSLSRPGSPHRAARRGCGAGHQPGDCAAAGREAAKSALRNYPVPLLSPPAGPLGVPKMPKLLRNKAGKRCKFDPPGALIRRTANHVLLRSCKVGTCLADFWDTLGTSRVGEWIAGSFCKNSACTLLSAGERAAAPGTELGQAADTELCPP